MCGVPVELLSGKWKAFEEKVLNGFNQRVILLIKNTMIIFDR